MATTGWSGLYNREHTDLPNGLGSLTVNKYPLRNEIKRLSNRYGFKPYRALFNALIGAATGGTATETYKREAATVKTSGPQGGGALTIETITPINRATVAGDVTALKEMLVAVTHKPSTYPVGHVSINPR